MSYRTSCPACGAKDELYVESGSFITRMPLHADGFSFSDAGQIDTEDESVRCIACGKTFRLSKLMVDD